MTVPIDDVHKALGGLHGVVEGVLDSFWRTLDLSDPASARDALVAFIPNLVEEYGARAASLAADWFDELRAEEALAEDYRSSLAETIAPSFVEDRVRFGAKSLWTDTPEQFLLFLHDVSTGYLTQAFNDTLSLNAHQDPNALGWVRRPNPGACDFCMMLAARSAQNVHGGVYSSRQSAELVQGRGVERMTRVDVLGRAQLRGGGVKARGSQQEGAKYHGHCRCVAVPIWPTTNIRKQHGFDPDWLQERYEAGSLTSQTGLLPYELQPEDIAHILHGERRLNSKTGRPRYYGGHAYTDLTPTKTKFPPDWDEPKIRDAVNLAFASPDLHKQSGDRISYQKIVDGVVVEVSHHGSPRQFRAAFPRAGKDVTLLLEDGSRIEKPFTGKFPELGWIDDEPPG